MGVGKTTIGRAPTNDIVLNEPSISNFHCEIGVREVQGKEGEQERGGQVRRGREVETREDEEKEQKGKEHGHT